MSNAVHSARIVPWTTSGGEHPVTASVTNVDGSDVNYKWHTDDN